MSQTKVKQSDVGREKESTKVVDTLPVTIYGVTYDCAAFALTHPGGKTLLDLARGRDGTRLFESYHIFNERHRAILRTLPILDGGDKVASDKEGKEAGLLPSCSALHEDLKAMVRQHFEGKSSKASPTHLFLLFCALTTFILLYILWLRGSKLAMVIIPLIYWIMAVNSAHDASHGALCASSKANDLACWFASLVYNPDVWMHQHVFYHHTHTNEPGYDGDIDLYHFNDSHTETGNDIFVSTIPYGLATSLHLVFRTPWKAISRGCYHLGATGQKYFPFGPGRRVRARGFFVTGALELFTLWYTSWWQVLYFNFAISLLFTVVTQISHLQDQCDLENLEKEWKEEQSDEAEKDTPDSLSITEDWIKGQALTSLDYSTTSHLWRWLTGGLNTQTVHHLFPGVCSEHYTSLYPKVRAVCAAHGVRLHRTTHMYAAAMSMNSHLSRNRQVARQRKQDAKSD